MTHSRRRFLAIAAAFAATPAASAGQVHRWRGIALGAEVEITLRGAAARAEPALAAARETLYRIEALFSLYDPASALARLNDTGHRDAPAPEFLALMAAAGHTHHDTNGLFDPTIQPLWQAYARGEDPTAAIARVGWSRVRADSQRISLAPGQALTFNGIAQGFATDRVADVLRTHGATDTLVNIGEFRASGGPWRLGLSDPAHGHLGTRTLTTGAIATSSPGALALGSQAHILHPIARPRWSTVAVEAATATRADALSTALTLADLPLARRIAAQADVSRITLVDTAGDVLSLV